MSAPIPSPSTVTPPTRKLRGREGQGKAPWPTILAHQCPGLQPPLLLLLLALRRWRGTERVSQQATGSAVLSRVTQLSSWPAQMASKEGAAPLLSGNGLLGVSTHALPSFPLLHQAAPTGKLALLSSPAPLQTMGPTHHLDSPGHQHYGHVFPDRLQHTANNK